jgi:hypothetical protein
MRELSVFMVFLTFVAFVFLASMGAIAGETPKPFAASSVREVASDTSVAETDDTLIVVTAAPVRITLPPASSRIGRTLTVVASRAEYEPHDGSGVDLVPAPGDRVEGAPNDWASVYSFGYGARVLRAVSPAEWRVVAGW